jgi:transposase
MRGRPKGGTNKHWSAEEKFKIIEPIIHNLKSGSQVTNETGINNGMINKWVNLYLENGLKGLENQRKPGNTLAKFSRRKELTELEKLQYENLLLKIENERLKKGYTSKEADLAKRKK